MVSWHRTRARSAADGAVSRLRPARIAFVAGVLAAGCVLAGCTPGAAPKPTPTPLFASEAEAYRAAEKVYRDYVEALNGRNAGDTTARPDEYLSGKALEFDTDSVRDRKAKGLHVVGKTVVAHVEGTTASLRPGAASVNAEVCINVASTRLITTDGQDVTPSDRAPEVALKVAFIESKSTLVITDSSKAGDHC